MPLPDPERLSLDDVAQRWGKTPAYVEDKFKHVILINRDLTITDHFYFDLAKWPGGLGADGKPVTQDTAFTWRLINHGVVANYLNPQLHSDPEGFRWSRHFHIYIPLDEVQAYERQAGEQPERHSDDHIPQKDLFRLDEVAKILKERTGRGSVDSLQRGIKKQRIKVVDKPARGVLIPRSEVLRLIGDPQSK